MITRRTLLGSFAATAIAGPALARPQQVFVKSGYAVCGYDPVAYFRKSRPVEGQPAHRLQWHNAIWQFESAESRAVFERNPHAFAPQYGGYCAMALAMGELIPSAPEAWAIHDDKLYLTQSVVARDRWLSDADARIVQGDAQWSRIFWG